MTKNQATEVGLLEQVLDLQEQMVRRGELSRVGHDVFDGRFCANGSVLIECTCGRGMISTNERESERAYALHIAEVLGVKVRWAVAA